jgi:Domain of unknown function (DUF4397)
MKQLLARLGLATVLAVTGAAAASGQAHAAGTDQSAAAATNLASITLVHGVSGLLVDIYVNGGAPIQDVAFTTVATVPGKAGQNTVAIRAANAPANSAPVLSRSFYLRKNQSKSVVAHLTTADKPALTVYANDQSPLRAGEARVTVRHDAAAPAVDIVVDNTTTLVPGLSNPHQAKADVPAGSYVVDVRAAGTSTAVLDDAPVTLDPGTNTIIYAIGSLSDGTFTVAAQVLPARPF